LNTANYAAATANNKGTGIQVAVSTVGKQNIAISFDERVSNTGSKYVRLQYSTNGTTFIDYPTGNSVSAASTFESKSNSLAGVAGVDNNPNFAFRIVTEWESTAIGSANNKYVAANSGSTYATTGTVRYDMVTVSGGAIPATPPSMGFAGVAFGTNGFQFSLNGTNATHGVIEYSVNLSNWFSLGTNSLPFTFTETNFTAPQKFYRARVAQ
jgi:nucleoid-associated protein YgaU